MVKQKNTFNKSSNTFTLLELAHIPDVGRGDRHTEPVQVDFVDIVGLDVTDKLSHHKRDLISGSAREAIFADDDDG